MIILFFALLDHKSTQFPQASLGGVECPAEQVLKYGQIRFIWLCIGSGWTQLTTKYVRDYLNAYLYFPALKLFNACYIAVELFAQNKNTQS